MMGFTKESARKVFRKITLEIFLKYGIYRYFHLRQAESMSNKGPKN
jgi:hypothetical protein